MENTTRKTISDNESLFNTILTIFFYNMINILKFANMDSSCQMKVLCCFQGCASQLDIHVSEKCNQKIKIFLIFWTKARIYVEQPIANEIHINF